ncbi:MAG: cobalt-precorrin-6A reductase [Geminicoccaceae bacterium]|nr:cobalt-precorrin-6A reductase [Geminicoccaceae bacterium]
MIRILLLAGTAEARLLAARLAADPRFSVTASLAGETREPAVFACPLRIGGFGGEAGLMDHLRESAVDVVVDATHPFARYPVVVARCCDRLGIPRLRLVRRPWVSGAGVHWREVADLAAAAAALPSGARALLSTGRKSRHAFAASPAAWLGLRVIDPPGGRSWHPAGVHLVQRPPFTIEQETETLTRHAVTHLVTRNSGGSGGWSKIVAASSLGVAIVMVARPPPVPGPTVETVDRAFAWLASGAGGHDDARLQGEYPC